MPRESLFGFVRESVSVCVRESFPRGVTPSPGERFFPPIPLSRPPRGTLQWQQEEEGPVGRYLVGVGPVWDMG